MSISYTGGSLPSVVTPDIENHINGLYPEDYLQTDDIVKILKDRGASYIQSPVDVMAVVHRRDRSVYLDWSRDRINVGRLAAFIPTNISLTRRT
jgi:hypothetical protein